MWRDLARWFSGATILERIFFVLCVAVVSGTLTLAAAVTVGAVPSPNSANLKRITCYAGTEVVIKVEVVTDEQ